MIESNQHNADVIRPIINGDEVNSDPTQFPSRSAICFRDWHERKAEEYVEPYAHLVRRAKPERMKYDENKNSENKKLRERWWLFGRYSSDLYNKLQSLSSCFVCAVTTKHLSFSSISAASLFTHALFVIPVDRWDVFSVVQSTLHEVWARKYSGALETRLRYSPSDCFETFPFPGHLWETPSQLLVQVGERYHEHRRRLMRDLSLGLTDIYNLFHARDLSPELVAKVSKTPTEIAGAGFDGLLELRRMHVALDNAVRDAYGWTDVNLGHDFVEVETLPENDRVRYTISPAARKEVLKRLLALNHQRAKEEAAKAPVTKVKGGKKASAQTDPHQPDLI